MIDGVRLLPLWRAEDERGALFHMLRCDSPHYRGFGEIYFSKVNPGAIKAWHRQRVMIRHYAVPVGSIRVVLFDPRPDSPSAGQVDQIEMGEDAYRLLIIPPLIWSGFTGLGSAPSLVADCTTHPFDAEQAERRAPDDPAIPYRWMGDGTE